MDDYAYRPHTGANGHLSAAIRAHRTSVLARDRSTAERAELALENAITQRVVEPLLRQMEATRDPVLAGLYYSLAETNERLVRLTLARYGGHVPADDVVHPTRTSYKQTSELLRLISILQREITLCQNTCISGDA